MNPSDSEPAWHCGGWEGAERETFRAMEALTLDQKLAWLESAQELLTSMHGREAALQPAHACFLPAGTTELGEI